MAFSTERTRAICSIRGCEGSVSCRGWCEKHYSRWRKNGDPLIRTTSKYHQKGICSIFECGSPNHSHGYCIKHYQRWRRNGDPLIRTKTGGTCDVAECNRKIHANRFCTKHNARFRTTGDSLGLLPRGPQGRAVGSTRCGPGDKGYPTVKCYAGHPLGDKQDWVKVHRKVMWDEFGEGPHPCWACGIMLTRWRWKRGTSRKGLVVINHLDENTKNNSLDNLVFSCNQCNRNYSHMIKLMKDFGVTAA